MLFRSKLPLAATWVAAVVMVLQPQFAIAAQQAAKKPADVQLQPGGILLGELVDPAGAPLAGAKITITGRTNQWQATTDKEGRFGFRGLKGGSYRLDVDGQKHSCRAWTSEAAPPSAGDGLLVVKDTSVVLGQSCDGPDCGCGVGVGCGSCVSRRGPFAHPLLFGAVVAAAIAIPIAIYNDDDDTPSSP